VGQASLGEGAHRLTVSQCGAVVARRLDGGCQFHAAQEPCYPSRDHAPHPARGRQPRAEKESSVAPDVSMDLRRAPADAERIPALVSEICDHLDAAGAAPAFCLTRDQRASFAGREDESRFVFLDLPE